ncbi:ABC transporter substrate-binding protein [Paenibacillus lignilyticus]|uniref:Sugar ABC transporter substrate-binding protein n=1 Tax=Paenibacillus lignilyticus TaxID=1172615 RepID=A0ABS5CMQ9_9BACL|nr:sugar ABC transporter substrate-binding protein [Paenibacillus lignilyticus]MBP3967134.1 sugar ABC transporter substrate-binding protein [Paenibacillus lignilyticus]
MKTLSIGKWSRFMFVFAAVSSLVFAAACSNSGKSDDKVTITMTYTGDENATKVLKARIDKYLDKSLNIEVQVTPIPGGEYWDKVTTMFAGGTQPDVLFMSEPLKKFASQGKLLDMNSYIEASSTFNKDDFYPASLEFYQYDGKQYGIPQDLNTALFFYNEDMFKAAGLKTPWELYEAGNWTWDTYLDAAQKLTLKDGDRVTQFGTSYPGIGPWWYSAWVFTNGGNYLNEDSSKSAFNDPKVIASLAFTSELSNKYGVAPSPASGGQDVTGMSFATGKIAMEANFSWAIGGYKTLPFKWNVAPMPVAGGDIDPLTTYIHNSGFSISKDTKHPDEAWAVIEALSTPDSYADDAASRGIIPPRPSVVDKKEILNAEGMPSNAKIISQMLEKGKLYQFTETTAEEDQVYITYGDQILNKKVTPEEGAKKIAEEIDAILSKKK